MALQNRHLSVPNHLNNNRGSVLIAMIALGGFIAITAVSVLMGYQSRQRLQLHAQAMQDAANIQSNVWMLFSSKTTCQGNVASGGFGSSVGALTSSASTKNLSLTYPVVGSNTPVTLATNTVVDHVIIKSIYFSSVVPVDTANSYLGSLHISMTDTLGVALNDVVMPFYFLTDVVGGVTGCFATSYPEGQTVPVTMQDLLCQQARGDVGFYYSPQQHACVDNPLVIGSR